jgi:hypothetical protein
VKHKWIVWLAGIAILLLALSLLQFRTKTVRQNDSAAIGKLRHLSEAEMNYIKEHPERGFACSLAELSESDQYSGYKLYLSCGTGSNGAASSFQLVAQPLEPKKTGIDTYCVTQERQIWHDANGSIQKCLVERRTIVE